MSVLTTLLSVARDPEFAGHEPTEQSLHRIASRQAHLPPAQRQVPEPWRGSHAAPLLVLGSNPSINALDDSPRHADSDPDIVDYFTSRGLAHFPRIRVRSTQTPGGWSLKPVSYWAAVASVASDLWGLPSQTLRAGLDFSLMEVVAAKSEREYGVPQALPWCMRTQWQPRIQLMQARVIVVVGACARQALDLPAQSCVTRTLGGRNRIVVTLDHPASFGKHKKPSSVLDVRELEAISKELQAARLP